ncbi:MAG TPA: hypothetical protein PLJ42_11115 [Chitinophagales bacterium]|jgi:hypothetical protein|nr:hypothetical protein [Chitinophagales bacterium]MBP6154420.1 hypothetical protein [Chitinophagales bacterium]HQV78986.1 hypothetical protein [Chitinophagales bacterium]HQW79972.1 hypothetical protein [Chitinophagales bacterium]HRB67731.1 hypothetical protein [Chitinophagales bacterium]
MKNLIKRADAVNQSLIARTAPKTSKALFLILMITVAFFSSCARQSASGCGAWICKSNMKMQNDKKYQKHIVNIYKCPSAVASAR